MNNIFRSGISIQVALLSGLRQKTVHESKVSKISEAATSPSPKGIYPMPVAAQIPASPVVQAQSSTQMEYAIRCVDDLLMLHGENFVEATYRALLGRFSDQDGRAYYLRRLQEGHGKVSLIAQIALSKEAQARSVSLPGLEQLMAQYHHQRHWLWGFWFRLRARKKTVNLLEEKIDGLRHEIQQELQRTSAVMLEQMQQELHKTSVGIARQIQQDLHRNSVGRTAAGGASENLSGHGNTNTK
jgi:Domain of unknown function (DUF4214)